MLKTQSYHNWVLHFFAYEKINLYINHY